MSSATQARPIVIFDTSAVNRLAKASDFEVIRAGVNSAYHVRITETVIAELVANENVDLRKRLFAVERMLRCPGDITFPHYKLLESLVRFFENHRSTFDWTRATVRCSELEHELARNLPDDELAAAQKNKAYESAEKWNETFRQLSATFDEALKNDPTSRPKSVHDLVEIFERHGGLLQTWGKMLYKKDDGTDGDEESIRQFYELCPPFRAMAMAMLISQYDRCFREIKRGEPSLRAGRADTLMATYLPYCNIFVSEDPKQINLLREVVTHAKIRDCSVQLHKEFMDKFMLSM
jgi:hypothetical protein